MSRQNTDSVQKHRAKMVAEGLARMEVTLGRGLIEQVRALAQQRRVPLWQIVQDALIAYLTPGNVATGNEK